MGPCRPHHSSSFLKPCLFGSLEGKSHADKRDVLVPAQPKPHFVVIKPDFFLQFTVNLTENPFPRSRVVLVGAAARTAR